ncbi:DUF3891 family protein [Paenibacillus sp. UNC451MF]|uniref:DUF3891 family protein n=1 Tax=Paenibacillus sp. UNC451MF TaxID=1449063 RepID=UPI00048DEC88|nr:DUF3891 family protein [Paenibacillus sp. UNC451MF]
MIIRETEQEFVMTTQHDHAGLSAHIAAQFCDDIFLGDVYIPDVLQAITEHDRAWIRLDHTPIWNDQDHVPFSFSDYPMLPKLVLYKLGIDEVEQMSEYAAFLCSKHYASFQQLQHSSHPDCIAFCSGEARRQARIQEKLKFPKEMIERHFQLLQLCDDISLYVGLNNPGSTKDKEHPWFRDGFTLSEPLLPDGSRRLIAEWLNEKEIRMTPFPFKHDFKTTVPIKCVSKEAIRSLGMNRAYEQAILQEQEVIFCN